MFHHFYGVKVWDYIEEKRVEQAMQKMSIPSLSMTEIASLSEFSSISNFNRVFRKYTGENPSDYKKSLIAGIGRI